MEKSELKELIAIYIEESNWEALALLVVLYRCGYKHHREKARPMKLQDEASPWKYPPLDIITPNQCGRRTRRKPGSDEQ